MINLENFVSMIAFYVGMAAYIKCDIWWVRWIGVAISMLGLQYLLVSVR